MKPELEIYTHLPSGSIGTTLEEKLLEQLNGVLLEIIDNVPKGPAHVLTTLDIIEISIVTNAAIAEVHRQFFHDDSPTDVITFPHGDGVGEIMVSIDTAKTQSSEFDEPWERELFRYMVHGLLHLHGYLDGSPEERNHMFSYQEPLVIKNWV